MYMKHTWVTLAATALICAKLPAQNLTLASIQPTVKLAETSTVMESRTIYNAETAINHTNKPAKALIERVVGKEYARLFKVEDLTDVEGRDVFEIESQNGKIILRGNRPVAVASALNWYLKYYCSRQVSWNNLTVSMPEKLPEVEKKIRRESPYQERSYMNYCTFSYSAAFWDWERWEKEIDWMALHGITMPLAITGQEAVWQNTLRKYGMSDDEIREFLVGPAFQAWQWMTNIEQWGGPLPQQWIDRSVELGKKILKRERELGMTPVLQGFTGYIPLKLKEKYPLADIQVKPYWLRYFPPGTAQLDPLDPLFKEIGSTFLKEQQKLFGTNHLYAADPFHEGQPPKEGKEYLVKVGKAIYDVTESVDKDAVIVMQSWSFRPDIAFAIPEDRLLVFDLNSSKSKQFDFFKGREWHGGVIHNFGGTVSMGGNLQALLNRLCHEGKDASYKHLTGFGLFPEAIENNPVVYELATEMAWHDKRPGLSKWITDYATARYGMNDALMQKAWSILRKTVYGTKRGVTLVGESPICARPHLHIRGASPNSGLTSPDAYSFAELWQAADCILKGDISLRNTSNYRYDLVDVMRQCLADLSIMIQKRVAQAYIDNDKSAFEFESERFLSLILDLDALLSTDKHFMLGTWINEARACGDTEEEKTLYEKNARWLVTVWGPYDKNAMLFDYSNRQWGGLMKDFYYYRWTKYLDFLRQELSKPADSRYMETSKIHHRFGRPSNEANDFYKMISRWEYDWCDDTKAFPDTPQADTWTVASQLYAKWSHVANAIYKPALSGEDGLKKELEPDKKKKVFGID